MRILLVEDDPHIGDGIAAGLKKLGMAVDWFSDGAQGQSAPLAAPYDAAVLDLGLPNIDGIEILRHWRKQGLTLPVLILTARDALPDRLTGLNSGADDYLCKPFALEELEARLNALVRRSHGRSDSGLTFGSLYLDTSAQTATLGGKPLNLTRANGGCWKCWSPIRNTSSAAPKSKTNYTAGIKKLKATRSKCISTTCVKKSVHP